jgi:hypothetical protein
MSVPNAFSSKQTKRLAFGSMRSTSRAVENDNRQRNGNEKNREGKSEEFILRGERVDMQKAGMSLSLSLKREYARAMSLPSRTPRRLKQNE